MYLFIFFFDQQQHVKLACVGPNRIRWRVYPSVAVPPEKKRKKFWECLIILFPKCKYVYPTQHYIWTHIWYLLCAVSQ